MSFVNTYNAFQIDNLTAGQKAVLTAIATFERNGKAWPSVATIAKRASMGVRTVQRHLAALINLGYITRTYRAGKAAVTRLFIGQTPAKLAGEGMPNWHPESDIQSVNQVPAAPPPEPLPAAAMPPSLFPEIPEQPKTAIEPAQDAGGTVALPAPVQANAGQSDAPDPTANELTADTATPTVEVVDVLAEVPQSLLADLGEVRKAKKKPAKVTRTEAQILKTEAEKAGWTLEQVIVTMICHGWSRFQADWVQHVPPQTRQIGQEAVFKPEVVQPASPSAVARFKAEWAKQKAQILADSARRREEMARLRQ